MNNILFGLFLGIVLTLFFLLLYWNQWKKKGYTLAKTKEEKEENMKSSQKMIPFLIPAVIILPIFINITLLLSTLTSFSIFTIILSWKLDSYFRAKNK